MAKQQWLRPLAVCLVAAAAIGLPGGYALGEYAAGAMNPVYSADGTPSRPLDGASYQPFASAGDATLADAASAPAYDSPLVGRYGAYPADASYTVAADAGTGDTQVSVR
jgi:hypothetical protein